MLYMQEGFLGRLAASPYSRKLILKGGFLLFSGLHAEAGRTTKDIDFLGDGVPNDPGELSGIVSSIVGIDCEDGLVFDPGSVSSERITEGADYHGVRLHVTCRLGSVRNVLQIDVGFGDAVHQGPQAREIRGLLGAGSIRVFAYPMESVIAEKFESMISLGSVNSRMKDFFDVWFILEHFSVTNEDLSSAIEATFQRRRTEIPEIPAVFSSSFISSEPIVRLWKAFLGRSHLGDIGFSTVIRTITSRLEPIYKELKQP